MKSIPSPVMTPLKSIESNYENIINSSLSPAGLKNYVVSPYNRSVSNEENNDMPDFESVYKNIHLKVLYIYEYNFFN